MQKSGKWMRKHHSQALVVGAHEVAKFEKYYAGEGIHVDHRKTACGDYEPIITSPEQFKRMLKARGMVDKS